MSPERRAATVNAMLPFYLHDAARVTAALAVTCTRHESDSDMGWDDAAAFLRQTLQRLRDAGADRSEADRERFAAQLHQELFPDPEPYRWPDRSSRSRSLWRRILVRARVRWQHQTAGTAGIGHQLLFLRLGGHVIGKLDYQVCEPCRRGLVRKLDVDHSYRGLGLGSRAIHRMQHRHPGYTWRTTVQYPTAGTFWQNVSTAPGLFDEDAHGACQHLDPDREN
ncbi:hypothetical protein [Actinoplanes sp. DH11]|uniref:hypothetical protein n=1 Tax=Actinoplanes sp. DH11 TaxID=2857011 RepID=UPI001E5B0626|nr:hypothetical protein [Actinoplanes sp. DH11]